MSAWRPGIASCVVRCNRDLVRPLRKRDARDVPAARAARAAFVPFPRLLQVTLTTPMLSDAVRSATHVVLVWSSWPEPVAR